jgi:hypothetical protein
VRRIELELGVEPSHYVRRPGDLGAGGPIGRDGDRDRDGRGARTEPAAEAGVLPRDLVVATVSAATRD